MTLRSNRIPYTQTIKSVAAVATAAKITETDTTNAVLLYTAPSTAPAFLTALTCLTEATTSVIIRCKLYIQPGGSGVLYPVRYRAMPVTSVSQNSAQTEVDFGFSDTARLKLSLSDKLYVATGVAATGIHFVGAVEEYELAT